MYPRNYNIKLTNYEQNIVEAFTKSRLEQSSGTNVYKNRGHSNLDKIEKDILNGASAEIATFNFLSDVFPNSNITLPDFEIYDARYKSFEPDLMVDDFGVHIKSVTELDRIKRGASWLFQTEDNLFKENSKELIIVTITDYPEIDIHGLYKVSDIYKGKIIKDPLLKKYVGIKQALYMEDLELITNYIKE